jgi:methionine synthase I (cobalamin-dependent)
LKRRTEQSQEFLERLQAGEVLVADGATGTMLQNHGLQAGRVPETWLFEQPDAIRALHRSYIEAGADLILTCSFGGTRYRLEKDGLADVVEVNRLAAQLARQEAGEHVFVVGDMGPTGLLLAPLGPLTTGEAVNAYAEQASGLAEGGVDILLVETMSDLDEALAAIKGARRATDLPIACTFSFDTHGRTMMGTKPETVAKEIGPLVEAVGANCGQEPMEYVQIMHAMRDAAPNTILWAKPNAGLPHLVGEDMVYDATPEQMAQLALLLREVGVQIIGGCCGTTPAHISAMVGALRGQEYPTPDTSRHSIFDIRH